MAKSLIRQQYPSITGAQIRKINKCISKKCSEYYFLGFLRCSNGNVDDAINFFYLDEKLRSLLAQYLMRLEIQLKSDFARMVEKSTRSKQFWKVRKYYEPNARAKRPGKRSKYYLTKKKIEEGINRMSPSTIGPLNYVAMYSISFGAFKTLYQQIDSSYEQSFIDKYTSHLSAHTYNLLLNYLESIRTLRNRCAHGTHIITKKFAQELSINGGSYIVNASRTPLPGQYVSYFEAVLLFLIKQLNCGIEFKKKLKALLNHYTLLLALYPTRHSLSSNTVSKIL